MHSLLSAFVAIGAFQALIVTAQDPACLANCASQVRADFTKFSCANADDAGCLCASSDFKNGVRDCSGPCGSADGDVDTFLNDGFCLAQPPPAEEPSDEPAPEASATEPPEPEATEAPESTAAPESTTAQPEEEPVETPVPESTEEVAEESSTEVQPETTAAPETSSAAVQTESSTTLSTSRTTGAANAGETAGADEEEEEDKDEDKDDDDEGGLSQTTIIGIAVGAGAAGLAAIGFLIWLCLRRRNKQDARPFIEISKPMPASGAGDYTGRRDPFAEKRGDVIEMQSNRYEDMLPRQEPRTVV